MVQPPRLRILVYGDADRGDNGAPLVAVGRLLPALPRAILDQLEVRRHQQFELDDLADLPAAAACLLVDTATGVDPGVVVTMPLAGLADAAVEVAPRSVHGRSIAESLGLLQASRKAALRGSFVGIGGRSYGFGVPLSIPVRNALPVLTSAIGLEINQILELRPTPARAT